MFDRDWKCVDGDYCDKQITVEGEQKLVSCKEEYSMFTNKAIYRLIFFGAVCSLACILSHYFSLWSRAKSAKSFEEKLIREDDEATANTS
mmetsp:Transcript_25615/g.39416  ORF Transcript_25615/g.39416 Transcript_25615/m.39416 type:complete len:90 (+) Transcript_25615:174-443(+)